MKVIIIMIIIFIIIIVHEGHQARGPEAVPIHRQAAARAGGEYLVTQSETELLENDLCLYKHKSFRK